MEHLESRNTLYVEHAEVLCHDAFAGEQYCMRLHAPLIAAAAKPGNFIHIQCDPTLMMRRPMSIMRVDPHVGWVDFLYKVHGVGTNLLQHRGVGEIIDIIGPIGVPFKMTEDKKYPLLIGGGVGVPPMIFLVEYMKSLAVNIMPLLLMGSEIPFPFTPRPSKIMVPGLPDGVIAAMPLLEDWKIASRLASLQGYEGCYAGYVTELACRWLDSCDKDVLAQVEIFACGPNQMLDAVSQIAADYGLPCQVCLEEYMACAVGGCAGCTVLVETQNGLSMQRVCVDGPVFDALSVFPIRKAL